MNFAKSAFYLLNEGAGVSVSDALGNAPAGVIAGTTTNLWANAGGLTISNAAGAAGDNAVKLQHDYFDQMLRLDNLSGSIVLMYWLNQPQVPSTGTRCVFSYGDINSNTDGAYSIVDQSSYAIYSIRDGAVFETGGSTNTESITAAENDAWFAYGIEIDVIDGKVVVSGFINGHPQRGSRLFNLEPALPRVSANGCGARLFARGSGASSQSNFCWGQTQFKRAFIGRVEGDQRHNIPKWMKTFYETTSGIPSFMVA